MVRELISRHIWSRLSTVVLITFRSLIYQMKILRLPRGRIFGSVLTADSLSRVQRGFLVVCPSMKQNTVSKLYAATKRSRAVYMKEIIIKKILLEWLGDREIEHAVQITCKRYNSFGRRLADMNAGSMYVLRPFSIVPYS